MSKKIKAEEYMNWDKNLYKDPTPLEAFEKLKNKPTLTTDWYERKTAYDYNKVEYDIIETALKRLDDLQQMLYKMNVKHGYKEYLKIIKVFDIIKEHFVNIGGTKGNFEGKKPTNEIVITLKDLTEEEYDLLKGVFKL